MKKINLLVLLGTLSFLFAQPLFADDSEDPVLDKVSFVLMDKTWVSTKTAKVEVNVNAVLKADPLARARNKIMSDLNKIASGDWHITRFIRSQDSSGLEKLFINAEARLDEKYLTSLNTKAKEVSVPGMTYKIQNVSFTPSFKEKEQAKEGLRERLYQKIQAELSTLNRSFKDQHYSVYRVIFSEGSSVPELFQDANKYNRKMPMVMMSKSTGSASGVSVSNELELMAFVTVAMIRKGD